ELLMEFRIKFWLFAIIGLCGWTISLMAANDARYTELVCCASNTPTEVLNIIHTIKLFSKEEVINAVKENTEPAYIEKLMDAYGEKLKTWASSKKIVSPKEKIAFLLMMHSIVSVGYDAARNAAMNAARNAAADAARNAATNAAADAARDAAADAAWDA